MDPKMMFERNLLNTLATCAVRAHGVDGDLIASSRRFDKVAQRLTNEALSRMDGGDSEENRELLLELMAEAIRANSSGDTSAFLEKQDRILEKIPAFA